MFGFISSKHRLFFQNKTKYWWKIFFILVSERSELCRKLTCDVPNQTNEKFFWCEFMRRKIGSTTFLSKISRELFWTHEEISWYCTWNYTFLAFSLLSSEQKIVPRSVQTHFQLEEINFMCLLCCLGWLCWNLEESG